MKKNGGKRCKENLHEKFHSRGHLLRGAVSKTEELVRQELYIAGLRKKVEFANFIGCILYNMKEENVEGFLNPIPKADTHLETYHINHVDPLSLTNKKYRDIFTVIDTFRRFTWFYMDWMVGHGFQ